MFTDGMLWRSWLKHFATSRKIAGLFPDAVIAIFDVTTSYVSFLWGSNTQERDVTAGP